jgi:hypothetical protein
MLKPILSTLLKILEFVSAEKMESIFVVFDSSDFFMSTITLASD